MLLMNILSKTKTSLFYLNLSAMLVFCGASSSYAQAMSKKDSTLSWFQGAKFGMFVHWATGGTPTTLNPVNYDANEWVRIAKQGGMKYITLTTKHHIGFCLWDTKLTDYKITNNSPFKRDVVRELADACKAGGIEMGSYYSIADYNAPLYESKYQNREEQRALPSPAGADINKYITEFMMGQLKELSEQYNTRLIWFDGGSGFRQYKDLLQRQKVVDLLHSYGTIANSRLGDDDGLEFVDYQSLNDNMALDYNPGYPWESAITINANDSWGTSSNSAALRPIDELLHKLISAVSYGGNLLLNVSPDNSGVIPKWIEDRLKEMGDWLAINGEAIHGTQPNPNPHQLSWGYITQREEGTNTNLYLIVKNWPANGKLTVNGLNNKVVSASLLATKEAIGFSERTAFSNQNVISLEIPKVQPSIHFPVIKLVVAGKAIMDQGFIQQSGDIVMDAYNGRIHDLKPIAGKAATAAAMKMATVPSGGQGIMPARGIAVTGFDEKGQSMSWDTKIYQPGTFDVMVLSQAGESSSWSVNGKVKVSIGGQSVEGVLPDTKREDCIVAPQYWDVYSKIGSITIDKQIADSLTLEVTTSFTGGAPKFRGVTLIQTNAIPIQVKNNSLNTFDLHYNESKVSFSVGNISSTAIPVTVTLNDLKGKHVQTLFDNSAHSGTYNLPIDRTGHKIKKGMYYCRMVAKGYTRTIPVLLK